MIVSELVEDLTAAFEQFPESRGWRIGVASYADEPRGDISVMHVASIHCDPDDEFFLVPEGYGELFGLAESQLSAAELCAALQDKPEWADFIAYTRSEVAELEDGSVVSKNMPLWGCGVQGSAQLVYFYFGPGSPEA